VTPRAQGLGAPPRPIGTAGAVEAEAARASALIVLQRTEALVAEETRLLRERQPYDAAVFNDRKGHALLELSVALRGLGPARCDETLLAALAALRDALEVNRRTVDLHLGALRDITVVLADAVRAADSDGTYAPVIAAARPRS
jgi:hypothetical protein